MSVKIPDINLVKAFVHTYFMNRGFMIVINKFLILLWGNLVLFYYIPNKYVSIQITTFIIFLSGNKFGGLVDVCMYVCAYVLNLYAAHFTIIF